MPDTPATAKPRDSHRPPRLMHCLLLGIIVWLAVGYWLDLKPLWTLHFDGRDNVIFPFHEDESGRYLVAGEYKITENATPSRTSPVALVILDSHTGKTLHRIASTTHEVQTCRPLTSDLPRWRQGEVWRLSKTWANDDSEEIELRVWQPGQIAERVVHRWRVVAPFSIDMEWPERSPIIITELRCRWQTALLCAQQFMQPMLIDLMLMDYRVHHWQPTLYQSWLVAETSSGTLQLLASWVSYETVRCAVSPDGERVALTCGRMLNNFEAVKKARRLGYQQLGPAELLNAYTEGKRAIQVYETRTGKLLKEILAPDQVYYYGANWAGSLLYTSCLTIEKGASISIQEFSDHKLPQNFFLDQHHSISIVDAVFQMDGTKLELPVKPQKDETMSLEDDDGKLNVKTYRFDADANKDVFIWHLLKLEGQRLVIDKQCPIKSLFNTVKHPIKSSQIVIKEHLYPEKPEWLVKCAPYSKWIKDYLERHWPDDRTDTLVKNLETGKEVYRWPGAYPLIEKHVVSRQHLFLVKSRVSSNDVILDNMASLECYALPVGMYSAWWARGAGMVVAVLGWVVVSLMRRKPLPTGTASSESQEP